ncbi:M48 family metalloprotease [Capnocytophaga genosp. AHN8471]|uniref:M48 family metalloprotease n=1 Tax=Capnocytophaga genosp. AHN8471 TaxID=327574 RepID=A0ABS1YU94_9FLAO|nr:M48 family metalloprotease [Capnocytophaga genosp. AHN8471]MBM0649977.1 M48 family metalloprotease [Capnocytophaga genosp. AHN8471]MBM0660796.1 M48 family metalloprotease [Capnocytophaga genosp. AHN8471]
MNPFFLYIIYVIAIFALKTFVAYLSFKIDKNKKYAFSDVFIWKDELFDSAVVSLIFILIMVFFKNIQFVNAMTVIMLALINSYYFLIVPLRALFQKKKYLKNEEIESFLRNEGYSYRIRIIKGKIENAFATGIFPFTKTILIGEPLSEKMTDNELKGVVFHEIGHLKLGHLYKMFFLNMVSSIILVFLYGFSMKIIESQHYRDTIMEPVMVALVGLIYGVIAFILIPYFFQRRLEYQADAFAVRKVGAEQYVQTLEKLNEITENKMMKGSVTHPSLKDRIKNAYNTR